MRIKINGEDVRKQDRITIETKEASNFAAWCVIILGALAAYGWWLLWLK